MFHVEDSTTHSYSAPPRVALCLECMHWWNADGGHICPDDRTEERSHPVALYGLTFAPATSRSTSRCP